MTVVEEEAEAVMTAAEEEAVAVEGAEAAMTTVEGAEAATITGGEAASGEEAVAVMMAGQEVEEEGVAEERLCRTRQKLCRI